MANIADVSKQMQNYENTLEKIQERLKAIKNNDDNSTKVFEGLEDKINLLSEQAKVMEARIKEKTSCLEQKIRQRFITIFEHDTDINIDVEDWINFAECTITITNSKGYSVTFTTKINYDLSDLILTQILNSIAMSIYDFFNHTNMNILEVKVW